MGCLDFSGVFASNIQQPSLSDSLEKFRQWMDGWLSMIPALGLQLSMLYRVILRLSHSRNRWQTRARYCQAPAQHARLCRVEATAQYLRDPDTLNTLLCHVAKAHNISLWLAGVARPPPEPQPLRRRGVATCWTQALHTHLGTSNISSGCRWAALCEACRRHSGAISNCFARLYPPPAEGLSVLPSNLGSGYHDRSRPPSGSRGGHETTEPPTGMI